MTVYQFPDNPRDLEYKIFPPHLENDPNVFFHGTAAINLESILTDGFRIPDLSKAQSISYATRSSFALQYASDARSPESPEGCVIAVRYADTNRVGLYGDFEQSGILHDSTLTPPPEVIGYCIVPSSYRHR